MPSEIPARAWLAAAVVALLLVASGGLLAAASLPVPGAGLRDEIPAGTSIGIQGLQVLFHVRANATLVGAWTASAGGLFWIVAQGASTGPLRPVCGATPHWDGRVNVSLAPGAYFVGLVPNPYGTLVVTETIRLGPLTNGSFVGGMVEGVGCAPPNTIGPPHAAP